ncbi:MAG: hypothetical protein M1827_002155 [Pycnora praestabilis]|nr:MAG: hypothetical protein M1827_002155 [Pycnora praestabilis]
MRMTSFGDLPNELLLRVLKETAPGDLLNLGIANKLLHKLAEPRRKRHLELCKTYYKVDGVSDRRSFKPSTLLGDERYSIIDSTSDSASINEWYERYRCAAGSDPYHFHLNYHVWRELLHDILECAELAYYVRHVVCEGVPEPWQQPPSPNANSKLDDELQSFCTALEQFRFLDADAKGRWHEQILAGNVSPIIGLLLPLLPNLQSVTVLRDGDMRHVFEVVSKAAMGGSDSHPAFSKLQSVTLNATQSEEGFFFADIVPWMALPSVRYLHAGDAQDTWMDGNGFTWDPELPKSNVTHLRLTECGAANEELTRLLGGLNNLRHFMYEPDCTSDYALQPLRTALLEHAGTTLESLDINISFVTMDRFGSLREFRKLKNLYIEGDLLSVEGENKIVDQFPASLEILMVSGGPREIMMAQFEHLLQLKEDRLPNLKVLAVSRNEEENPVLRDQCRAVGVTLEPKRQQSSWNNLQR